jgi:DNA-binding MarR family transcriptional regulator
MLNYPDNPAKINRQYATLSKRADLLYSFVETYNDYINGSRDYGTGLMISMVEVHILTLIHDHPGTTVSDLAGMWNRTKSAVSQNISKLEKKGLIFRERDEKNAKVMHLYVTDEGETLTMAHKAFDISDIKKTQDALAEECAPEEIRSFYKVLDIYYQLMLSGK